MPMNATIKIMQSHRSIRKFTNEGISDDILGTVLASAQCAATSSFIQAYSIIRVKDSKNRKLIADICGVQPWIVEAPVFLIFCADLNRLGATCERQGKKMMDGYVEQFIVATVDTALMAQNTMLAAESLGLGGVFIGAIRNDPEKVCELLNIPQNAYPVFGMCLGYPDHDPPRKPRLPLRAILKEDSYHQVGEDDLLDEYDKITHAYYQTRDSNTRDETWSRQMATFMSKKIRPHMKAFIKSKGFCLR